MRVQRINSAVSRVAALAALVLVVGVVVWPDWAEQQLRSRWAVALVALQCEAVALVLNPELRAGMARGFREFMRELREL